MDELFARTSNFKVVRLSEVDARGSSDHLRNFRKLVLENEPMYPNIKRWMDEKVIRGIRSSERIGYVGYVDEEPAVSAVVKRGESTKFCHLRIKQELQDIHLGEAFFALMGLEVKPFAREIHFTLPESVWESKKGFFKAFGFNRAIKTGHQYRLFEDELRCSSPFKKVWEAILGKLPKLGRAFSVNGRSLDSSILMSIKAKYAKKLLSGKKRVEIRRKFSKKWNGKRVCLYASRPERSLVGEAVIGQVIVGEPASVWEQFNDQIGCSWEEFNRYAESLTQIYAIVLEEVIPYEKSISLNDVCNLTNKELRPPQNYYNLENNKGWAEAVSVGALLQNSFRDREQALL